MEKENKCCEQPQEHLEEGQEKPMILEEINIEELAVDGICGIY